jgi:hypothetical protein
MQETKDNHSNIFGEQSSIFTVQCVYAMKCGPHFAEVEAWNVPKHNKVKTSTKNLTPTAPTGLRLLTTWYRIYSRNLGYRMTQWKALPPPSRIATGLKDRVKRYITFSSLHSKHLFAWWLLLPFLLLHHSIHVTEGVTSRIRNWNVIQRKILLKTA